MKAIFQIPDEKYEQLEAVAKAQGKLPATFLADAFNHTLKYNPNENQILLSGKEVSEIGLVVGGKTLKTGADIVKLMQAILKINANGVSFDFETEDLHALKAQYSSFESFLTWDEYIKQSVNEALSQYLWGSTRGTLLYK